MSANGYNPFENAQAQFDRVAEMLDLDNGTRQLLRQPQQEIHFTIPVKMDDGSVKVFDASKFTVGGQQVAKAVVGVGVSSAANGFREQLALASSLLNHTKKLLELQHGKWTICGFLHLEKLTPEILDDVIERIEVGHVTHRSKPGKVI